jgi:hypothetical protein
MDTPIQNSSGLSQPKSDGLAIDVSALAESAKAKLGEIGAPVKDKAIEVASQQKDAGAEQLQAAARAVHGAARELESAMPQCAGYIREFGERLDQFASDIRNGSVDDLMGKLGEFARNQPALLFGGALLTGFALSRFVKSSAQTASSAGGMDTTGMGSQTGMSGMSTMQSGPRTLQSGGSSSGIGQGSTGSSGSFNRGGTGGSF